MMYMIWNVLITRFVQDVSGEGGEVATSLRRQSSKLLNIIGLFCRTESLLQGSFVKETYIVGCDSGGGDVTTATVKTTIKVIV